MDVKSNIKKIDLNKFDLCKEEDILEGHTAICIVPMKLTDGTQPPPIFFKRGEPKQIGIVDTTDAVWEKTSRISRDGSEIEYGKRVDWWFDNAVLDDEYKALINETFNRNGYEVKIAWEKARNYMKTRLKAARKTYPHQFVWNWLTKGMQMQLDRLDKKRSGSWR